MPCKSRPQSRAFAPAVRRCLMALLAGGPLLASAQSTPPAVSTLVAFSGSEASATPVRGPDGALYGTTATSSFVTGGVIYRLAVDGSAIQTLYQIKTSEGYSPLGGLLLASDGRLYGTTSIGSVEQANTGGTVFALRTDGTGYAVLHRFASYGSANAAGSPVNADGANPESELVEGSDGYLYGVTRAGGSNGNGVVFKVGKDGTGFTVLHEFAATTSPAGATVVTNADGIAPVAPLVAGADGYFYGTAPRGGASGNGTIFRLRFDGAGFEVLRTFPALATSSTTAATNADGAVPLAGLTDGQDGRLYGVTSQGGSAGYGTLFALDAVAGVFTVLHAFDGNKGSQPSGELLLAQDGKLYGTTATGGTNASGGATQFGTIFSIGRDGTGFTSLFSFSGNDGSGPTGALLQLDAATFIGLARGGGRCSQGAVFQFSLTGATVKGITNCGQKKDKGGGGTAPLVLLLLGLAGAARRMAAR